MGKYSNPSGLSCSFCHKPQREVDKIIAGPNVYICSECIKLCLDIIRDNSQQKPVSWGHQKIPPPARIKASERDHNEVKTVGGKPLEQWALSFVGHLLGALQ